MGINISKFAKEGTVVKVTASNEKKNVERRCKDESKTRKIALCHDNQESEQGKISNEHNCSSSTESSDHCMSESADALDSIVDGFEIEGKDDSVLVRTNKVSNSVQEDLRRNDAQAEPHFNADEKSNRESANVDSEKNSYKGQVDVGEIESVYSYSVKPEKEEIGNESVKKEKHKERTISEGINKKTFETSSNINSPVYYLKEFVNYPNRGQVSEKYLNKCLFEEQQFISCKISIEHDVIGSGKYFTVGSFLYLRNRMLFQQVYAIGFRAEPILLSSLGDVNIIKNILLHQDWRRLYLEDEHFRLATFSLWPSDFDKGKTLRLAAWGYFYDVDGRVKCAYCEESNRSEVANVTGLHSPNCIVQFTRERVGRSIAEYYGASSTDWLVPSGQNLPEQNGIGHFIDISIRRETFRIGGTQQVTQDIPATPDREQYLREESTARAQISVLLHRPDASKIHVTEVQGCRTEQDTISETEIQDEINPNLNTASTQQGFQHKNQVASLHSTAKRVAGQDKPRQYSRRDVREQLLPNSDMKAMKTDEHRIRRNTKDMETRNTLLTENGRLRSRTQCCICKMRRCNIVFKPCGHFVVCNQCIENVTICPKCEKKVDTAYQVSNEG